MRNTIAASSTRQSRLLAALLGCALVLAAVLAWRAYRAVSEQRASVIRQLQDEADYAAFMFATHAGRDVYWGLVDLFAPVTPHNEVRRGGPQVPLASVVNDPCEYDFTCAIRTGARGWFRLDLRSGASERISTSRSGLPAWLLDSIRTRLPEIERPASSPFMHFVGHLDDSAIVFAVVVASDSTGPAAAYGLEVSGSMYGHQMIQRSTGASRPLLPASIRRGHELPYALRLSGRGGRTLAGGEIEWRDATSSSPAFVARIPLDSIARDLFAEIALRSPYVNGRLASASPSWGLALILLVFVLDAIVVVLVATRLRRVVGENRWRANFTASVSHELRTPLTKILLYGESLRDGSLRSERDRRNATEVIVRQARHLLVLIENLLRFSRAEHRDAAGDTTAEIAISSEIAAILDELAPRLATRDNRVETRIDDNIVINAEPAAFRQLVSNLLDNAVKYGPIGQTIVIGDHMEEGTLRLWIDDQGSGIPRADREAIWEPFVRLPSTSDLEVTGTGLGLAVVRQLTQSLGGRAWIEDAPGGGARFVIELPRARVRATEVVGV